jgi:uncharacterized protein
MSTLDSALDVEPTKERRRFNPREGRLVGGICANCGARTWPRRSVCFSCGSTAISESTLPPEGVLTTWTRVWVPVEGIEPPYMVGIVDVDGLQLFGHVRGVTDATKLPARADIRVDTDETPPFWFVVASQ